VSTPNRRSAGHDNAQPDTAARGGQASGHASADKVTYTATGRSGVVRRSTSATRLTHAVDVKIAGRKGAQFAAGVVVAFYASKDKAQAAADSINAGAAGDDWTDAVVVGVAS